jgi:hypothetical protein
MRRLQLQRRIRRGLVAICLASLPLPRRWDGEELSRLLAFSGLVVAAAQQYVWCLNGLLLSIVLPAPAAAAVGRDEL